MACVALSNAIEVRLAGLRIADKDIENFICAAVRCLIDLAVKKRRDVGNLLRRQTRKIRHAPIGAADLHEIAELLAALVVNHENGADEIRTSISAPRIRSVTETALRKKRSLSPLDGCLIEYRCGRKPIPALTLRMRGEGESHDQSHD